MSRWRQARPLVGIGALGAIAVGVIAGLFVPDRDAAWPPVDPGDSLYQQDLRHFVGRSLARTDAHAHLGH